MYSIAFWNCRGAKKKEASHYLKEFVKDLGILFVGLVETKIGNFNKVGLGRIIGKDWDLYIVPSDGLSGAMLLLWRSDLASFSVFKESDQCVIEKLKVPNKGMWMVATVYGSKEVVKRRSLWGCIREAANLKLPLVVGGDFNCIISQDEKRRGRKFLFSQGLIEMVDFMNENDLHDVKVVGPMFTWCNNKSGSGRILERLDRFFLNTLDINLIQDAQVRDLARIASDHCHIVLKIFDSNFKSNGLIKFEDVWLSYRGSTYIIDKVWKRKFEGNEMEILNKKCKKALKDLHFWGKAKANEFTSEKDKLKEEIFHLQEEEANVGWLCGVKLLKLRTKVRDLNVALSRLNTWWKQRAKVRWYEEGDANTKFFHSFARARRSGNQITQVKNRSGKLTKDPNEIQEVFYRYFLDKWKQRNCLEDICPAPYNSLDDDDRRRLSAEVSYPEIAETIKSMGNNRAAGVDGISY
ncbi:uncharacterized protein LOC110100250 [Dendrobium catenatum]|uniref:uncharacterized protein LOC110100250 n=1 Tax=Dendrobium catenatum TaxID=906689 RepID=UPI0009F593FE|nr:uncharacterized protein LOC110100250 [Dendrobium catenatum]